MIKIPHDAVFLFFKNKEDEMPIVTGPCVCCQLTVSSTHVDALTNGSGKIGHGACLRGHWSPPDGLADEFANVVGRLFAKTTAAELKASVQEHVERLRSVLDLLMAKRRSMSSARVSLLDVVKAADKLYSVIEELIGQEGFTKLGADVEAARNRVAEIVKEYLFYDLPFDKRKRLPKMPAVQATSSLVG